MENIKSCKRSKKSKKKKKKIFSHKNFIKLFPKTMLLKHPLNFSLFFILISLPFFPCLQQQFEEHSQPNLQMSYVGIFSIKA